MGANMNLPPRGDMAYYCTSYLIRKYDEVKYGDEKYALIQINIKNFRFYNTRYGNEAGNELLAIILGRLLALLSEGEYAAHLYADNFGLLFKCQDGNSLMYGRMMDVIDSIYRIQDPRISRNITYSMGIYEIRDPDISFYDALNFANLTRKESDTLYKRSTCMEVYGESWRRRYMDRMDLEEATANAYKEYEFVSYLQPKVDLKTGRIIGAEALLRWFGKDGSPIPLYQFLPILDHNSYIYLVDLDMFDQACKYLEERVKAGKRTVPISFNISKSAFYSEKLFSEYTSAFEKYSIPKHLIEIEFMESISLNDVEHMKAIISDFKNYGFTCTLDDFGNGYSSFNVLLNAPFDIVKMDRQFFVNNLNGDSRLVIKTVVDLIHSLKMQVVAEGVELQEHIDCLKECNCDFVQGYYYYKPMPIEEFERLLDAQD